MKIGFLGNTNNYPFMVARALKRRGHDVLFLVDSDQPLHRPEFRYEEITTPYPDWVVDVKAGLPGAQSSNRDRIDFALSLILATYRTPRHRRIVRLLQSCDAVVLNAYGISFLGEVGRPAFAMLVGYDLEALADPAVANAQLASWKPLYRVPWRLLLRHLLARIVPLQSDGIRRAEGVSFFAKGLVVRGDRLLDEIGLDSARREFIMMTELDRIPLVPPPHNEVLRVFCGTRLNFVTRHAAMGELDYKGSDIMIRGLAEFIHRTGTPLNIRLVEKGADVQAAKELIAEVGITEHVTWLSQMSQLAIAEEIEKADVIIEHLGSTFIGMMGLDSMAVGRPVIANARPEIFEPLFGAPSPICQATTVEEVAMHFERLTSAEERERVGKISREYVGRFFSTERAADIVLRRLAT